ncbi:hypothetical protein [Pseudoduganella sp. OTU4001]|uniref:hypothetical protein n=1 Tax=Pseudoduganella sp. OTU4001 TaxID=3043854 RepID=UPI00313AFFC4
MKDVTRPNEGMALVVYAAIEMDASFGCVFAWQHMQMHAVPQCVAMRVLSLLGPRRASTSNGRRSIEQVHVTEHAAKRAGLATVIKFQVPRINTKLSDTIDQAIEMMGMHNRFYAEALLRIHAVKTPAIMRVLFDAKRRRRIASLLVPPPPAHRLRLLHTA